MAMNLSPCSGLLLRVGIIRLAMLAVVGLAGWPAPAFAIDPTKITATCAVSNSSNGPFSATNKVTLLTETNLFVVLKSGAVSVSGPYATVEAAQKAGAVTLNYGVFINTMISFVIVTFAVFLLVRAINRLRRQEEAKPAASPEEIALLREIRDSLKKS